MCAEKPCQADIVNAGTAVALPRCAGGGFVLPPVRGAIQLVQVQLWKLIAGLLTLAHCDEWCSLDGTNKENNSEMKEAETQ